MSWDLYATVYELKGNLSQFLRALGRGDADCVVVTRYQRPVAIITPLGNRNKPALEPQTQADRAMRARSVWNGFVGAKTRRPPPSDDISCEK